MSSQHHISYLFSTGFGIEREKKRTRKRNQDVMMPFISITTATRKEKKDFEEKWRNSLFRVLLPSHQE